MNSTLQSVQSIPTKCVFASVTVYYCFSDTLRLLWWAIPWPGELNANLVGYPADSCLLLACYCNVIGRSRHSWLDDVGGMWNMRAESARLLCIMCEHKYSRNSYIAYRKHSLEVELPPKIALAFRFSFALPWQGCDAREPPRPERRIPDTRAPSAEGRV